MREEKEALMKRLIDLETQQKALNDKLPTKDVFEQLQEVRLAKAAKQAEAAKLAAAANTKHAPTRAASKALPHPSTAVGSQMWRNIEATKTAAIPSIKREARSANANVPTVTDTTGQELSMAGPKGTAKDSKNPDHKLWMYMYEKQCNNGVFSPGPRCQYHPTKLTEQTKCKHPFEFFILGWKQTLQVCDMQKV